MLNLGQKKYLTDSCYYLGELWATNKIYDFQVEKALRSLKETIEMLESLPNETIYRSSRSS